MGNTRATTNRGTGETPKFSNEEFELLGRMHDDYWNAENRRISEGEFRRRWGVEHRRAQAIVQMYWDEARRRDKVISDIERTHGTLGRDEQWERGRERDAYNRVVEGILRAPILGTTAAIISAHQGDDILELADKTERSAQLSDVMQFAMFAYAGGVAQARQLASAAQPTPKSVDQRKPVRAPSKNGRAHDPRATHDSGTDDRAVTTRDFARASGSESSAEVPAPRRIDSAPPVRSVVTESPLPTLRPVTPRGSRKNPVPGTQRISRYKPDASKPPRAANAVPHLPTASASPPNPLTGGPVFRPGNKNSLLDTTQQYLYELRYEDGRVVKIGTSADPHYRYPPGEWRDLLAQAAARGITLEGPVEMYVVAQGPTIIIRGVEKQRIINHRYIHGKPPLLNFANH